MIAPATAPVIQQILEEAEEKSALGNANATPYMDAWNQRYAGRQIESTAEFWAVTFAQEVFAEMQKRIDYQNEIIACGVGTGMTKKLRQTEKEVSNLKRVLARIDEEIARYGND